MNVFDDSSPKTPFGATDSHESFMQYVRVVLWKAEEYDNWIGPPGTDEWYSPAEFLEKFSEPQPDYHLFFHNSRRKKPIEIITALLEALQEEKNLLESLMSKLQRYYQ